MNRDTWSGEKAESRRRALLGQARDCVDLLRATPDAAPDVFAFLCMAEEYLAFEDLFRTHLRNAYWGLGCEPHAELMGRYDCDEHTPAKYDEP